ncbi:MAG: MBL fold metallo-hydrolase [Megasphaera sp.]|nr:MBL fold metallo-hydrolase [Megasphaera sp.]MCI1248571.1 MBL fold metallo-hydrolase [Megasphaera sp.]
MTESEQQLQALALSVSQTRQAAGCAGPSLAPQLPLAEVPNLGGEARRGDCLVSMLASGSKGNAAYFQCGQTRILIDAGISCRRIEQGLKPYGCQLTDLDAVFITHEHTDHVNGLPTLLKRTHMPVYTTQETWQAVGQKIESYTDRFVRLPRMLHLKDIQVVPFAISHDAARPVGYTIYHGDCKMTLATDLGFVSQDVADAAAYADILVLEANHDEEMLKNGPYPYMLQQRILGNHGHLSNMAAAGLLADLPTKGMMRVLLAHRSEKNNTPALSLHTMRSVLSRSGKVIGQDILLRLACQHGQVRFQDGGNR